MVTKQNNNPNIEPLLTTHPRALKQQTINRENLIKNTLNDEFNMYFG